MSRPVSVSVSLAGAVLVAAALTGCGSPSEQYVLPEVTGAVGSVPEVKLPAGKPPTGPRTAVAFEGSGPVVAAGQSVVARVDIRVWKDNSTYLSSYQEGEPTTIVMGGTKVSRAWDAALTGKKAGSRVVLTVPASQGFGPRGMPPTGTTVEDTLVVVFDVLGSYAPEQAVSGGRAVPLPPELKNKLPEVLATTDTNPVPRLEFPDGSPPPGVTGRTLVEGDGPVIGDGSTVVLQSITQKWKEPLPETSSYANKAPQGYAMSGKRIPPEWAKQLKGAKGGSRIMIVESPGAGAGARADAKPQVSVVDVLDVT